MDIIICTKWHHLYR